MPKKLKKNRRRGGSGRSSQVMREAEASKLVMVLHNRNIWVELQHSERHRAAAYAAKAANPPVPAHTMLTGFMPAGTNALRPSGLHGIFNGDLRDCGRAREDAETVAWVWGADGFAERREEGKGSVQIRIYQGKYEQGFTERLATRQKRPPVKETDGKKGSLKHPAQTKEESIDFDDDKREESCNRKRKGEKEAASNKEDLARNDFSKESVVAPVHRRRRSKKEIMNRHLW
eukprot:jgi/Bigna1/135515/aug1.29_g10223